MAAQYESYKKIKELGAGSFGKAFLVECASDKSLAVIKQIDINSIKSKRERDQIEKEGKILEHLNHINIIGFREVYKTKKGKICIVMEYADGGDLADMIKKRREQYQYLTEDEVLNYFTQLCLAIKHIHDRKIIHRDLKAQNIFLEKNGTVKLGDFGIARVLEQTQAQAGTQVGTPYYISPEIIKGKRYSFSTDIWSLGIILYELCALDVPIKAKNLHELYMKISNCSGVKPLPRRYSQDLQDLVDQMLVPDPKKRPSVNQILKNSIIKEKVKKYLNDNDFEEEFSHTILHNRYLFDMRKQRAKPHLANPQPEAEKAPPMTPIAELKPQKAHFQKAPSPKNHPWVSKESPRAQKAGFAGHRPLSSRKKENSASKPGYRPYSAKYSSNQKKNVVKKAIPPKGLLIQGEEIRPIVSKEGKRNVFDLFEEEKNKISREREQLEQKKRDLINKDKERVNRINEKVNNIYKIAKPDAEEEKVLNENYLHKPSNFQDKPLSKQLKHMKPSNDNFESSKENNPFCEDSKNEEMKSIAKQKIEKYRKSIINFLDSESDNETEPNDGLETNREVSEDGEREDDNIMEASNRSLKPKVEEKEKDLTLDIDSDPEPIPISGDSYFKKCEPIKEEAFTTSLKSVVVSMFGIENTEKGIEFLKTKGTQIYDQEHKSQLISDFKVNCFEDSDDSIRDFISTVSSIL